MEAVGMRAIPYRARIDTIVGRRVERLLRAVRKMHLVQLGGKPGRIATARGGYNLSSNRVRAGHEHWCQHQCHHGGGLVPRHAICSYALPDEVLTGGGPSCDTTRTRCSCGG